MNSAIDPVGSIVGYGKSPKITRANQAEEEEQIDLIKKLEEEEANSGEQSHQDAYQGSTDKENRQEMAEEPGIGATESDAMSQTDHVHRDEHTNEEEQQPLRHIDVKA